MKISALFFESLIFVFKFVSCMSLCQTSSLVPSSNLIFTGLSLCVCSPVYPPLNVVSRKYSIDNKRYAPFFISLLTCLSLALYLHVPLIGDVSCLATKQSGPDCCHDNMAGVSSWRE